MWKFAYLFDTIQLNKVEFQEAAYYENDAYDAYCFRYNGTTMYRVDSDFPCMRKKSIPIAAQNVRYDLSLAAIQEFKEG